MWKAIFKHRILLFHQAELFIPSIFKAVLLCVSDLSIQNGKETKQKALALLSLFRTRLYALFAVASTVNQNHFPLGTILI